MGNTLQLHSIHPIRTATEFYDVVRLLSPNACAETEQIEPSDRTHSPQKIVSAVVRCLRRPRPKIQPNTAT